MILVSANGGLKHNLKGQHTYSGNNSTSKIYTEMVLRDYHFLINNAYSFGGELSYTRKSILGDNSSLFVSATIDHTKAMNSPKEYNFGGRTYLIVKAGLTF